MLNVQGLNADGGVSSLPAYNGNENASAVT